MDRRPNPGSAGAFASRFDSGIDCDLVFKNSILIGNL
jgi:hypothetical protein